MNRIPSDEELHRALRALPGRQAPPALAANVRAILQRRARAWWRQPYAHWPAAPRVALPAAALATCGLAVWGMADGLAQLAALRPSWLDALAVAAHQRAETVVADATAAALALPLPWALGIAAVLATSVFACAAGGTLLWRLTALPNAASR